MKRVIVSRNRYFDSVFLMQVAQRMKARAGVHDASALLATPANKKVLVELGYGEGDSDFMSAKASDLVIALEGDEAAVGAIAGDPESWLRPEATSQASGSERPRSIVEAVAVRPDANLAVISVPGQYAAREARSALEQGLNVFLFSSNVPVADELALKQLARDKGLIVMGPDCGTAYIAGAGLGFANAVRRGNIGIVAAAGTGTQEFASLVHRAGSGISQGIGVGGRDMSDAIGGISTMTALDALEADPRTSVIVVIAKSSGSVTQQMLFDRCVNSHKPVVLCLLGSDVMRQKHPLCRTAALIDDAVALAVEAAGGRSPNAWRMSVERLRQLATSKVAAMRAQQRQVRGLFAGGTFCYQTQAIFRDAGIADAVFVDMGAEMFVQARPHPMIDATLRRQRLVQEAADPSVALVILDFVLGANASRDPVGDMLPAIQQSLDIARRRGDQICFAASICGTESDRQDLGAQRKALIDAGVEVFTSNAEAAAFARECALLLTARMQGRLG